MEVENFIMEASPFHRRRNTDCSLLRRGYTVNESPNQMDFACPALSCRRPSLDRSSGVLVRQTSMGNSREAITNLRNSNDEEEEDQENMDIGMDGNESPVAQTRRATISSGTTGNSILRKRPSNIHDWPLGEPKVRNDDDYYELELNIGSFKPDEVSAKIMGKELIVHCKADPNCRSSPEGFPKEIFRCYPLPLSHAPTSTDISIVKDDYWLKLAVKKESVLRSPIGLFVPEINGILEEEHQNDVEEEL